MQEVMPTPAACPRCASTLVSVDIRTDGHLVTMHSCTTCDRRWLLADGVPTDPTKVFAKR